MSSYCILRDTNPEHLLSLTALGEFLFLGDTVLCQTVATSLKSSVNTQGHRHIHSDPIALSREVTSALWRAGSPQDPTK